MSPEPEKLGYRPALDGLRAVAITAVLLFHTGALLPGGYFGVDLFFVLSGFLITTLLLEEHAARGAISLRAFYRRRALRLLPALVVLLGVFLVVCIAAAAGERALGKDVFGVAAGLGYFSNLVMAGEPMTRAMPDELRHLWSLAEEEQFYVLWPLVLVVLLRRPSRLMLAVVAAAAAATVLRELQLYLADASFERIAFGPDTRSLPILVGCLLALVLARSPKPLLGHAGWLAPLSVACVLALFTVPKQALPVPGVLLAFSVAGAALIVVALEERSIVARSLATRPMVYLGCISYSLYLWHLPIFVVVGLNDPSAEHALVPSVAAVGATFACAIASYHFVELPFLRRKRHVGERSPDHGPVELAAPRPAETRA